MKSKFIKSTLILILGGLITKLLAMVIKIYLTRAIGHNGIGLYMLILPTFNLFINLSTLSLTTSTSKIVSEGKIRSKKIILPIIPLSIIYNIILMFIIILVSPFISSYLLKNPDTYYPLMSICLTLPFICLSGLFRGYFFGKQKMLPSVISNAIEQLIRLILTIYFIPHLIDISLTLAVTGVVLINIISELTACIILILFMPKNNININDFKMDKNIIKEILNISIPQTTTRLIGSIVYFLEPIIITYALIKAGYSNSFITKEYGIINGYVYALLLLPSFFTMAISNALLPVLSKSIYEKKYKYAKNKLRLGIIFSLIIGIPSSFIFMIYPDIFLKYIFNTTLGIKYIKVAAPFVILHYIQSPLVIMLNCCNMSKIAMRATLYGGILKSILLFILCLCHIGLWPLIISISFNIVFVTTYHYIYVKKYFKTHCN